MKFKGFIYEWLAILMKQHLCETKKSKQGHFVSFDLALALFFTFIVVVMSIYKFVAI
ncbi:hypothetical protein ACWXVM_00720 [Mycoplasma sp. 2261]